MILLNGNREQSKYKEHFSKIKETFSRIEPKMDKNTLALEELLEHVLYLKEHDSRIKKLESVAS